MNAERRIKAILINPWEHTVEAIEMGEFADLGPIVGAEFVDVRDLGFGLQAAVPDTGIIEGLPGCLIFDDRRPLAGRVLLLGYSPKGETVDCPVTAANVRPIWISGPTAQEIVRAQIKLSALEAQARRQSVETSVDGFVNIIHGRKP